MKAAPRLELILGDRPARRSPSTTPEPALVEIARLLARQVVDELERDKRLRADQRDGEKA